MKHVAKDSSARTGNWIDTFGFCDVDVDVKDKDGSAAFVQLYSYI